MLPSAIHVKGWLRAAWRDMGPWKWVGVAAIVTVILLTPATARGQLMQITTLVVNPAV